ncbi:phage terminase large subunit family protein [Glaciimonas soli]|nr:terminase gpA endonuclease subunit [Glaciimonas soli]
MNNAISDVRSDMFNDPDQHYSIALADICSPHTALQPPRRISVSQGAKEALFIKQPGGYVGPWSAEETPYMVEPMDMLASRRHEAVCFVGPARTGKTLGLLEGWMSHAITNDPGDMLFVQMTQDKAREYSKTRIDRALRHSPNLAALKSGSSQDDNTHDKMFKHGMWLRIGWPTVSQLSSSDYRYVALTDYDRMADDIDGEGSGFALGLKRTTTFLSRGMCLVESSPGRDVEDPGWRAVTNHEAPPTSGILGIYNRSDRRRWYWKCFDCADWFEAKPGLELFHLPPDDDLIDMVRSADIDALAKEYTRVVCPHCGSIIQSKFKHELNMRGRWLQDGQHLTSDDEMVGTALTSSIAGYWLGGVAAAYQPWKSLVTRHLQGLREYALSGSELTLKTTVNTDQGLPYTSRHLLEAARNALGPADRKEKSLARYIVPDATRFLIASVDVQGGTNARFVVQVHAVGENFEQWLVNRFNITESRREGMGSGYAPIDPASYAEDWDRITEEVIRSTYRTSIEGKELRIKLTVVDSGGEDGVTDKAYAWYRRLRRDGLYSRVMLYKGASSKTAPIIKLSKVGNRHGKETGDVDLYVCNPNLLSDAVDTGLKRKDAGANYIHFPSWLPQAFFDELNAEVRGKDGIWKKIRKRNESFDLCRMIRAGCLRLGVDKIKNWQRAPHWAALLDVNSEVVTMEERREMKAAARDVLIADQPARRMRRVAMSPYIR